MKIPISSPPNHIFFLIHHTMALDLLHSFMGMFRLDFYTCTFSKVCLFCMGCCLANLWWDELGFGTSVIIIWSCLEMAPGTAVMHDLAHVSIFRQLYLFVHWALVFMYSQIQTQVPGHSTALINSWHRVRHHHSSTSYEVSDDIVKVWFWHRFCPLQRTYRR